MCNKIFLHCHSVKYIPVYEFLFVRLKIVGSFGWLHDHCWPNYPNKQKLRTTTVWLPPLLHTLVKLWLTDGVNDGSISSCCENISPPYTMFRFANTWLIYDNSEILCDPKFVWWELAGDLAWIVNHVIFKHYWLILKVYEINLMDAVPGCKLKKKAPGSWELTRHWK